MSAEAAGAHIAVVYHSRGGHTAALAEALAGGARAAGAAATLVRLPAEPPPWELLAAADAIVFGSPTHFGGVSAEMKQFMDATDPLWRPMAWRDKLAAGFTCGGEPSGDKLGVLLQLAIFAAQHGMVWIGVDPLNDQRSGVGKPAGYNRHGGYLGAMADSAGDAPGPDSPPGSDRATAERHGRRIALAALRWRRGAA
ncbi:MAG: flavodoxin family protein [Dongiaceae bacterium]